MKWNKEWDREGKGTISLEAFAGSHGLLSFIRAKKTKLISKQINNPAFKRNRSPSPNNAQSTPSPVQEIPDLRDDLSGWFEYFDVNNSQTLSKLELRRGLIISFDISKNEVNCLHLMNFLNSIWPVFCAGEEEITKTEFLKEKDGLGEILKNSL